MIEIVPQRNPIATTTSSGSANDGKLQTGGKIRSLQDMQSAIAKAGETKKKAERQGKLEQIKRAQREARKNEMTKEERRFHSSLIRNLKFVLLLILLSS